jgi:hypothetical protein
MNPSNLMEFEKEVCEFCQELILEGMKYGNDPEIKLVKQYCNN